MDGMKQTPCYLPHDIIEIILSRLPVKPLLRLKGVCKQWSSTISDPNFAETHLKQSKNSSRSYLEAYEKDVFRRVQLENHEFRVLSALEYLPAINCSTDKILCHCDGLVLISAPINGSYVLWNPSCRKYKMLRYPYPLDSYSTREFGICYDPFIKDYKVVIGDAMHYALFYCKNNSWSEMKEMNNFKVSPHKREGVPFNGSIYWVFFSILDYGDTHKSRFEIVCFDGRDEKFKNLRKLGCGVDYACLTYSGDGLYLFLSNKSDDGLTNEIVIMKKDGDNDDEWTELTKQLPFSCDCVVPLRWTHENKIILLSCRGSNHLLYDHSKTSFTEIQKSSDLKCSVHRLFPYIENLFLL